MKLGVVEVTDFAPCNAKMQNVQKTTIKSEKATL